MRDLAGPTTGAEMPWSGNTLANRWDGVVLVDEQTRGSGSGPDGVRMSVEDSAFHVRISALENLIVATMATAGDGTLDLARQMAEHLSPGEDIARYSVTVRVGDQMSSLIDRADRMRTGRLA